MFALRMNQVGVQTRVSLLVAVILVALMEIPVSLGEMGIVMDQIILNVIQDRLKENQIQPRDLIGSALKIDLSHY